MYGTEQLIGKFVAWVVTSFIWLQLNQSLLSDKFVDILKDRECELTFQYKSYRPIPEWYWYNGLYW